MLNPPHHQENDEDNEQEADAAARVISPPATVGPRRQRADQDQDQDDEEDCAKHIETRPGSLSIEQTCGDRSRFPDQSTEFPRLISTPKAQVGPVAAGISGQLTVDSIGKLKIVVDYRDTGREPGLDSATDITPFIGSIEDDARYRR